VDYFCSDFFLPRSSSAADTFHSFFFRLCVFFGPTRIGFPSIAKSEAFRKRLRPALAAGRLLTLPPHQEEIPTMIVLSSFICSIAFFAPLLFRKRVQSSRFDPVRRLVFFWLGELFRTRGRRPSLKRIRTLGSRPPLFSRVSQRDSFIRVEGRIALLKNPNSPF